MKYGINLYGWKKICWKCGKETTVYSYFLYYELEEMDEFFSNVHGIGLGSILSIDQIISGKYKNIKDCFSRTTRSRYIANVCEHCGSLQGRNYVVDDPHEIFGDLFHDRTMEKYLVENIKVEHENLLEELEELFNYSEGEEEKDDDDGDDDA
jgi:hypothetical protein